MKLLNAEFWFIAGSFWVSLLVFRRKDLYEGKQDAGVENFVLKRQFLGWGLNCWWQFCGKAAGRSFFLVGGGGGGGKTSISFGAKLPAVHAVDL